MSAVVNVYPGAEVIASPWYGYPTVTHARNVTPTILAVLHVTDGMSDAATTTRWGISLKDRSWTFCLDRDGHVVQSLDPMTETPWTNGDTKTPDMSNPVIAAAVNSGRNFNEWCFLTIECVGTPDANPITNAQRASIAHILAWGSKLSGLPADRRHVIGHYQVNSVTRSNCPVLPAQRAAFFAAVLEDDMASWVNAIKPVDPPYEAILGPDTNIRYSPDLEGDASFNTGTRAETGIQVIGHVVGDTYAGSTDWMVYALNTGGLRVVHSSQKIRTEPLTGVSQDELNAANARALALGTALTLANARLTDVHNRAVPVAIPK